MRTLLRGGQVYDGVQFRPADIALEGNRIVALEPHLQAQAPDQVWELGGDLVIPGLINAHYHSPDNLMTGQLPAAPLELWSLSSVPGRSNRPDELRLATLLGAAQLLLGGVTGVVDMVRPAAGLTIDSLDAVAGAYLASGIRAAIVPVVRDLAVAHTLPLVSHQATMEPDIDATEQLDVVLHFSTVWHGRADRITVQVGPSGPQRCSDGLIDRATRLAADLGTLLHTHAVETQAQAVQAHRRWGTSLLNHLDEVGALTERTVLAHVVWPDADDIDLLARRRSQVIHNPSSNCTLGSGRAPVPTMLAAGVRLGLGTDAATCNDGLSMFESMKLSTILHRPFESDWDTWVRPSTAVQMATIGGAAALDRAGHVGAILPGYLADLVVLSARDAAFIPPNNLVSQLVMRADRGAVRHVFVGGQPVVQDGKLLSLDWNALADEAIAYASRHKSRSGEEPQGDVTLAIRAMLRNLRAHV
ncbi:MAG: amidohydrolase family protein [Chloroflexota bacterium]